MNILSKGKRNKPCPFSRSFPSPCCSKSPQNILVKHWAPGKHYKAAVISLDGQPQQHDNSPSAIDASLKASLGRGFLKQDVMRLSSVLWQQSPCHQRSNPRLTSVGISPAAPTGSHNGAGASICVDLLMWRGAGNVCNEMWNCLKFTVCHSPLWIQEQAFFSKEFFCDGILRKNRPLSSKNGERSKPAPERCFDKYEPIFHGFGIKNTEKYILSKICTENNRVVKAVNKGKWEKRGETHLYPSSGEHYLDICLC